MGVLRFCETMRSLLLIQIIDSQKPLNHWSQVLVLEKQLSETTLILLRNH